MITKRIESAGAGAEIEEHGRTHCGPPQARPGPHGLVDVFDAGHPGCDQMDRFAPDGGLQPVGDMAGHLPFDPDCGLADGFIEPDGAIDDSRSRQIVAHHLDQRDQVRRIEGMAEDEARRIAPSLLHLAEREAGRGTGDDGVCGKRGFDFGKERMFDRQPFRNVLLDEGGALDRLCGTLVERDPVRIAVFCQAELGQGRPGPFDVAVHAVLDGLGGVIDRDRATGSQKQGGPAGADHAGSDVGGVGKVHDQNNPGLRGEAAVMPPSTVKHSPVT